MNRAFEIFILGPAVAAIVLAIGKFVDENYSERMRWWSAYAVLVLLGIAIAYCGGWLSRIGQS